MRLLHKTLSFKSLLAGNTIKLYLVFRRKYYDENLEIYQLQQINIMLFFKIMYIITIELNYTNSRTK